MILLKQLFYSLISMGLAFGLMACSGAEQASPKSVHSFSENNVAIVDRAESLSIHLPDDLPEKAAIINPKGEFIIVHSPEDNIILNGYSTGEILQLDLNALSGQRWTSGSPETVKAFPSIGNYKLYLANNLETEPENTNSLSLDIEIK